MDNNIDNILVINLDRSKERLSLIKKDLDFYGLKFTRLRAIDGFKDVQWKNKTKDGKECILYDKFNKEEHVYRPRGRWGREGGNLNATSNYARKGSLGNWLSHIKCWEYIIENELPQALILEDDALLVDDFMKRFENEISHLPKDCTALLFGLSDLKRGEKINSFFSRPACPARSHAYMVTGKAAKSLIDEAHPIFGHIDGYLGHMFGNKVPCAEGKPCKKKRDIVSYKVRPPLINQRPEFKSTMYRFFIN